MKTLIIGYNHPYNDKRVLRTVNALKKKGKVFYQYSGKRPYKTEGVESYPVKKKQLPGNRFTKRLRFDTKILEMVDKLDYDIAYFHYFPASMPLRIYKQVKKRNKKLIFDLHEIFADQFLPEKFSFLNPLMWRILSEQFSLCDGLISISDEALEYMFKKTGVTKPSLVVKNLAKYNLVLNGKKDRNKEIVIVGKTSKNLHNTYSFIERLKKGGFSFKSIGIDTELADKKLPFLPYKDMMKEISKSAFSLVSYQNRKNPNYSNEIYSLPNKFFDSLAAGTPIIINNRFVSMKKIIDYTNSGIVLNFEDDMVQNVKKIFLAWDNYNILLESLKKNQEYFAWNKAKENELINFVTSV